MTKARWIIVGAVLLAVGFAVQGGEYSTWQWRSLREARVSERARIAVLRREVDSLARAAKLVETDLDTQERIAREQYGMLRPGEFAYILIEPEKP